MNDKRELYKKAKDSYYKGEPIMSDEEFDLLESEIGVGGVGGTGESGKLFKHMTRMLSLSKEQADKDTGKAPTEKIAAWIDKGNSIAGKKCWIEVTPKFDGNAANCIYRNGKLWKVLSRYDGEYGMDRTEKIRSIIPAELPVPYSKSDVEIRGEIIMKKSVFDEKYSEAYANPRNFVAGILNKDGNEFTEDLEFIAYDGNEISDGAVKQYLSVDEIKFLGFNGRFPLYSDTFSSASYDFDEIFSTMERYRSECDLPLDGFVLKFPVSTRGMFPKNDHDPEWGKAVKFKPVGVTTDIVGVEWNIGKTGKLTPVALLTPVELDGSVVSKVSLYNAGYVDKNDIHIGTRVRLVKSGDIIPQIIEIFK